MSMQIVPYLTPITYYTRNSAISEIWTAARSSRSLSSRTKVGTETHLDLISLVAVVLDVPFARLLDRLRLPEL